jgi:hypothetical protein
MSRGYADGPATEERQSALESVEPEPNRAPIRQAVYGSTEEKPEKHFIGWLGDVDPDELFDSGRAWGISIVRKAE